MTSCDANLFHTTARDSLEIFSCGLDWLTTTTEHPLRKISVTALASNWLSRRGLLGHKARPYASNGFVGEFCDGVTLAESSKAVLVRLSGECARDWGPLLLTRCDTVSRLDVQVTLRDHEVKRDWAHLVEVDIQDDKRIESGMTKKLRMDDGQGGVTLYIGRRISNRFYRVYNKAAETKGEYPDGCWRFEIEYKAARAEHWASRIRDTKSLNDCCRSIVASGFRDYGFILPCAVLTSRWQDQSPRKITSDERRLLYLGKCIRPMIFKLKEAYDPKYLAAVLGLAEGSDEVEIGEECLVAPPSTSGQVS